MNYNGFTNFLKQILTKLQALFSFLFRFSVALTISWSKLSGKSKLKTTKTEIDSMSERSDDNDKESNSVLGSTGTDSR